MYFRLRSPRLGNACWSLGCQSVVAAQVDVSVVPPVSAARSPDQAVVDGVPDGDLDDVDRSPQGRAGSEVPAVEAQCKCAVALVTVQIASEACLAEEPLETEEGIGVQGGP